MTEARRGRPLAPAADDGS